MVENTDYCPECGHPLRNGICGACSATAANRDEHARVSGEQGSEWRKAQFQTQEISLTPPIFFPEGENDEITPEDRLEAQRRADHLKRRQDEKLNPRFVLRGAFVPGILIVVAFMVYAAVCYFPQPTRSFRNVFWIPHVIVGIALAWMFVVLIIDRLRTR